MENIETLLAAVAQTQGFDDDEPAVSTAPDPGIKNSVSGSDIRGDIGGSHLAGEVSGDAPPSVALDTPPPPAVPAYPAAGPTIGLVEKRKRGRPPRGHLVAKPPPPKRAKVEVEEEDVCFICFDGGSLVLCDRKGCPKAYHPACIKRDEAYFKSKAKWTCGWHICSVCRKASCYVCYSCTYSLCKGCTKDADYVCVRGNKGFCSTCMKTIMLIENKDQANSESVQVDFDDQTSWEYLFKVYWVYLKEKLSFTLSELTQAKSPWKGVAAVCGKPQLSNVLHTAVGGKVSISYRSTEHLELNKPQAEIILSHNDGISTAQSSIDNHVEKLNSSNREDGPSHNKDTLAANMDKVTDDLSIDKATNEQRIKETTGKPDIKNDQENLSIGKHTDKPCIWRNASDKVSDKPGTANSIEWASKDLLEFVGHIKNGDVSPISQSDVQTLLIDYIKTNNLWDPRRKSRIICDSRLKNLFGKSRVGHIEMLKLLEYHFLIKEDSQKSSFIPAGIVSSDAGDMEADGNFCELPLPPNNKKRKVHKIIEERTSQNNLNEYAAIDAHNINLIYLRRNLAEQLSEDHENCNDKVVGSIVRIRVSSNDQEQDVYRLVQVVGTHKVVEPYKIGNRTADIMLEVLNLDKQDVVSIDALSDQEFTEDECRWLRQSIRCGLVKPFTVGEIQKIAMSLQPIRINDWLKAEILRLNHLRDRASEKGHKKELREYVEKLQQLKSPAGRQHRYSAVPQIHSDPKMSPNYESEEDTRIHDNIKKDESSHSVFSGNGRASVSPSKKGKEVQAIQTQNRIIEKTDASASHSLDKPMNQVDITNSAIGVIKDQAMQRSGLEASTSTASAGNSQPTDNIETETLWHYRDPNGKIQGPFSMMQLRKCSTTGLFPPDMRIWTNHELFDSLLLTDALNGKFHGASELSYKPSSGLQESGATGGFVVSECANETGGESKQTEAAGCKSVPSDTKTGPVRADQPGSSSQSQDSLKDNNCSPKDDQARNLLPSSGLGQTYVPPGEGGQENGEVNHGSQNGEKNLTVVAHIPTTNGHGLQNQFNDEDRAGVSSVENLRSLNIDLSSNDMETAPILPPASKLPDSNKQSVNIDIFHLPSSTPKAPENKPPVSSDVHVQSTGILELLSPAPRSNIDDQGGQATEAKHSGLVNFPMPNSGPSWNGASSLVVGGVQLPEVAAHDWFDYSPSRAKPSVQEWDSGLVSASSSKPPEVTSENITSSTSGDHHAPSAITNWLANINEPIEFDALGEESVSDLLAEVDAMESRGALPSPTSAMKFARELLEDCKDDCFSSIEEFSPTSDPRKSDAFSSTGEIQLTSQSSEPCKPIESSLVDAFDFLGRSSVHSSTSSKGETNAPVYSADSSSEFHPPAPNQEPVGATTMPTDTTDPSWGTVQGNINLLTVQGNVNLVFGGPGQGMANLSWGPGQGTPWPNPGGNRSPINTSLSWDGQRKYGERFNSPREWGYQGRPPWSRQPYGGGYSRPLPKGQRVCKFYESGHCKKGAFCDYLHP